MKLSQNYLQDYDFKSCLDYNSVDLAIDQIKGSVAFVCGHNDEDDWIWVFEMKDGKYAMLTGGCDYTGWDCQSSASVEYHKSAKELVLGVQNTCKRLSLLDQLSGKLPWGMEERKP